MATEHLTRAELGRALGLEAGDVDLPVIARSLTRAELRGRDGGRLLWLVIAYGVLAAACIAVLLLAPTRPVAVRWLPLGFIAAALAIGGVAWFALKPSRSYRDPGVTVTVDEQQITVSDAEGPRSYDYGELAVARIITRTAPGSLYFEGIELETPGGNIVLGDPGFVRGSAAAGAILRRFEAREAERGARPEPAQ